MMMKVFVLSLSWIHIHTRNQSSIHNNQPSANVALTTSCASPISDLTHLSYPPHSSSTTGSSIYPTANPASVCRRNGCRAIQTRFACDWHISYAIPCSRHCCTAMSNRDLHSTARPSLSTLAVGCSPENWHWWGNCIACTLARSCFCKASSNQLLAHKLMSAYHEMPRTLRVCCKPTICSSSLPVASLQTPPDFIQCKWIAR